MKKSIFIMVIFVLLIILIFIIFIFNFNIKYEYVATFSGNISSENSLSWFTLRDEKYHGFFDETRLENLLKTKEKLNNYDFNYEKYTYVITVGHELKQISYSFSQMKNRKLLFMPKQFVGNVELTKEYTDKIYVYRIKKMDIDCDYHNRERGVSFS